MKWRYRGALVLTTKYTTLKLKKKKKKLIEVKCKRYALRSIVRLWRAFSFAMAPSPLHKFF